MPRRIVTEPFALSAMGPIARGPTLRYGARPPHIAVTKFGMIHTFRKGRSIKRQWFNLIAFDRLAEHIATRYRNGSFIRVLRATPWTDRVPGGGQAPHLVWVVREIGEVPVGHALPAAPPSGQECEVILDDEGQLADCALEL